MAGRNNDEFDLPGGGGGGRFNDNRNHHHYMDDDEEDEDRSAARIAHHQNLPHSNTDNNANDFSDEDDEDDEDFEYETQRLTQQHKLQSDPNRITPQQLLELQRQKEEEEEARKYYEPIELEKTGVYHVKDLGENTFKHRWRVDNVSQIRLKMYSPDFIAGGYKWRILIFPHGNNVQHVSMYLDVADAKTLETGWCRYARFQLSILNQIDIAKSHGQDAEKRFNAQESDWGFREFLQLSKFKNPEAGFLVNDTCIIEAVIHVSNDAYLLNPHNYDSKKETGFVGFKNQGATCYMNSLLQTLFHISYFRKAVYQMPIAAEEKPETSIPLALQRVFHRLQYESGPVDTKELTRSFGWDTIDSFLQHDVQELARVLMDNLEKKMENTPSKGTMKDLFEGTCKNYIKCINVDYESSGKEPFYDLQLNVKGSKDVYQSFEQYIEEETLEGENQYQAEGHGLQDAKKGSIFLSFPPVLMLHLKRFEYDIMRDIMYKINDRYEFPLELDLTRFLDPSSESYHQDNTYCLFSILVHSGDVSGGHYYAFIQPHPNEEAQWYKFDDEKVYKVRKIDAVDESFGGEEKKTKYFWLQGHGNSIYKKFTNAYMLVYIRKSRIDEILKKVQPQDVPEHLKIRFEQEKEHKEQLRREKAEAWKYCNVKVATDNDLRNHQGADLINFEAVEAIRVKKDSTLAQLKDILSEKLGIAPDHQRFWKWEKRQNKTNRPDSPIDPSRENTALDKLFSVTSGDVCLYLEQSNASPNELPFEPISRDDLLLFFKYYDPESRTVTYCGSHVFKQKNKVADVLPIMKQMVAFDPNTILDVYEEVRPTMIEAVVPNASLKQSELQHGDILIFQKSLTEEDKQHYEYPGIPDYYRYLAHRIDIQVCALEDPEVVVHNVELLKTMSYQEVVTVLARYLNTDPEYIRLTGNNPFGSHPVRTSPFRTTEVRTLKDMIVIQQTLTTKLYYEILDVPITEIENKKEVHVSWFNSKVEEVEKVKLLLPKDSSIAHLIEILKGKLVDKIEDPQLPIRAMAVHNHKITRIFRLDELIDRANSGYTPELRAESIPREESEMNNETHRLIQVTHYCKDSMSIRTFGNPFLLVVGIDDTVGQVKEHIKSKIQVKDEEFKKYKFAPLSGIQHYGYFNDDEANFWQEIEKHTIHGMDTYLGMEHKDPTPRAHSRYYDKPIIIKN